MIDEIDFTVSDTDRLKKTITSLSIKMKEQENEKFTMEEKLTKEITKLKSQLSAVNRTSYIVAATEKSKQIIKLFAFGFSIGSIFKICNEEMQLDVSVDEVESIVNGIDFAHQELQRFYIEMKNLFQEKTNLDKGFFASSLYKKLQLLENELSLSMVKAKEVGDEQLKIKCVEHLTKIYEKMSTIFSKNGLDIFSKQLSMKVLEDYDKRNNEIFNGKNSELFEISIDEISIN